MALDKESHIQNLLNSFRKFVGRELIDRKGSAKDLEFIEQANFVLVSHNGAGDPILNYGNPCALKLWELEFEAFTQTPSRKTAEPDLRARRQEMLEEAQRNDYFDGYEGVRVSSTGKRFAIKNAIIWTVVDSNNNKIGQAATFKDWEFLNS